MKQSMQNKALNVMLVISMVWMGGGRIYQQHMRKLIRLRVQEDQLENTLSKLEIEGIKLDQLFSSDLNEYSATVKNEVQTIKLLVKQQSRLIDYNKWAAGFKWSCGTYSLQTGENKFLISVNDGSRLNKYLYPDYNERGK